jgi:hypothetical protein
LSFDLPISKVVRSHKKLLEIYGIQDVRSKHKQKWTPILREWTTPDSRNTPSNTNIEGKGSWTPYETLATRRCRNMSTDLIFGGGGGRRRRRR